MPAAEAPSKWCNRVRSERCEFKTGDKPSWLRRGHKKCRRGRCKFMHLDSYCALTAEERAAVSGCHNIMKKHSHFLKKDIFPELAQLAQQFPAGEAAFYMWFAGELVKSGWRWPETERHTPEPFVRHVLCLVINTFHYDLNGAPELMFATYTFLEEVLRSAPKGEQGDEPAALASPLSTASIPSAVSPATPMLITKQAVPTLVTSTGLDAPGPDVFAALSLFQTDGDADTSMPQLVDEPAFLPADIADALAKCFIDDDDNDCDATSETSEIIPPRPVSPTMAPRRLSSDFSLFTATDETDVWSALEQCQNDEPSFPALRVETESGDSRCASPVNIASYQSYLSDDMHAAVSPTNAAGKLVPSILKKTSFRNTSPRTRRRVSFDCHEHVAPEPVVAQVEEGATPFLSPPTSTFSLTQMSLYEEMCLA